MNNQKLLSIIVPIYKVEAYINKCLDSLIVSSALMEKLEVILINDGTPDNSADLSRDYTRRFPGTFRQIDKENGGHGSAWNVGLREAHGEYIKFLDSDDWLTNLEPLIMELEHCDADLVFNPFIKEYLYDNTTETIGIPSPNGTLTPITPDMWGTSKWGHNSVNFWSLTYKTSILKPLDPLFAEKTMFDDYILTWAPLVHGRSYISFEFPVYHYLVGRPGQSMTKTQQRKGAESYVKCFDQYESVRSRVELKDTPNDLIRIIDQSIMGYANFIFAFLIYLPYNRSYRQMHYLWKKYLSNKQDKSKLLHRYEKLPFPIFFIVEHLRRRIILRNHV